MSLLVDCIGVYRVEENWHGSNRILSNLLFSIGEAFKFPLGFLSVYSNFENVWRQALAVFKIFKIPPVPSLKNSKIEN